MDISRPLSSEIIITVMITVKSVLPGIVFPVPSMLKGFDNTSYSRCLDFGTKTRESRGGREKKAGHFEIVSVASHS